MKDNDIVKALECLKGERMRCQECAYMLIGYPACYRYVAKNIDNLINRQKAEIERLKALSEQLGNDVDVKLEYIYELEEKLETAKAEAIKEFAERLKSGCARVRTDGKTMLVCQESTVDYLVKEKGGEME